MCLVRQEKFPKLADRRTAQVAEGQVFTSRPVPPCSSPWMVGRPG